MIGPEALEEDSGRVTEQFLGVACLVHLQKCLAKVEPCGGHVRVFIAEHGYEHPDVAGTHLNMGSVHCSLADYEKALFHFGKAQEVFVAVFGYEHPRVTTTFYNLACLHASRDIEQCRMMLAKAEETGCLWQAVTIAHVQQDSDLDPVRHLDWFTDLLSRGKAQT